MAGATPALLGALRAALLALLLGVAAAEAPASGRSSCPAGATTCGLEEEAAEVSLLQRVEKREQFSVDLAGPTSPCDEVGARAWITSEGIQSVLDQVWPTLMEKAANFTYPTLEGEKDGWKWHASGVTMVHYAMDVPTVDLKDGANIKLRILGFSIDSKFDYRVDGTSFYSFLYSSGQVRADLRQKEEVAGEITINITPDGKPQLKLHLGEVAFKLGGFMVEGSIFSGLIEFLVSIFQDKVEAAVSNAANQIVDKVVNEYLNKLLDQINFKIPVPISKSQSEVDAADMSLCYAKVGDDYLEVGVNGAIMDPAQPARRMYTGKPETLSKEPPKALKRKGTTVAVELTPYTPNTGFAVLQGHGFLNRTIEQAELPSDSPTLKFDMSTAGEILPGLEAPESGAPTFFKVDIASMEAPTVKFAGGGVEVRGKVRMALKWANGLLKDKAFLEWTAPFVSHAKMFVCDKIVEEEEPTTPEPTTPEPTTPEPTPLETTEPAVVPQQITTTELDVPTTGTTTFVPQLRLRRGEGAEQETVHMRVKNVTSTPITFVNSRLHANMPRLKRLVEEVAEYVLIPYINDMLEDGIRLPEANGLHLASSKVVVEDGDIIATSSVAINMHAFKKFADHAFV